MQLIFDLMLQALFEILAGMLQGAWRERRDRGRARLRERRTLRGKRRYE